MNETLRTDDGRYVLRIERHLSHSPAKVWRAVTQAEHLSQWFPSKPTMELAIGADVTCDHGDGPQVDGVVVEVDEPRVLAFTWGADAVRLELVPNEGGCLLILSHMFDDKRSAGSFAAGWSLCVDALEAVLRNEMVPEHIQHSLRGSITRQWADRHEAFVKSFGLDEGAVEQHDDGWHVRFERQLTRPVDSAWRTLHPRGGAPAVGDAAHDGFMIPGQAGEVTKIEPPTHLEVATADGYVRWELSDGAGGAVLTITHAGRNDREPPLAAWQGRVEAFAAQLHAQVE